MVAITPIRQNTVQLAGAISPQDDDGMRWLALPLVKVAVVLGNAIQARYALSLGEQCPKCGHAFNSHDQPLHEYLV